MRARGLGRAARLTARTKLAVVEYHSALPYQDMGDIREALARQEGVSVLALRLLILTTTRTTEVLNATWAEVDLDAKVWTIPPSRMTAGKEHGVPLSESLSDLALNVLRDALVLRPAPVPTACVFPGAKERKPRGNMALLMLLRRMGGDGLTAHGFRSTFRDRAGETTAYQREVIEHALSHQLKDKAEAA